MGLLSTVIICEGRSLYIILKREVADPIFLKHNAIRFGYRHGLRLTIRFKIERYCIAYSGQVAHHGRDGSTDRTRSSALTSKKNYCMISVSAIGVLWSTILSTTRRSSRKCHPTPEGYRTKAQCIIGI